MDPLLLKHLGERQLEQLRAEAARDRATRRESPGVPRAGSVVAAVRRTTGGALISVGLRLRGERQAI